MDKWYNYYKNRVNSSYQKYFEDKYSIYLHEVSKHLTSWCYAIEVGCGIGNCFKFLLKTNPTVNFIGIDKSNGQLNLAYDNLSYFYNVTGYYHKPILIHDNMFNGSLTKYGSNSQIIFGHGVLEHFSEAKIRQHINEAKKCAKYIVHYVPSAKYKKPSFGDELLLTPKQWKIISEPDEIIEFNKGYDLVLKWRGRYE